MVWTLPTRRDQRARGARIVNDGIMFVATPGNQVIALEAATGRELWRYKRPLPDGVVLLHPTTRGVALYDDKVFLAANEAVLVALDARTGTEFWTTTVEDNSNGYYMTMAPLVADGKVMVSASGGEYGVRGFRRGVRRRHRQAAVAHIFGAGAGRARQRHLAEGRSVEERRRTDVGHRQLRSRQTNLAFWGTGNGGPWMGDQRPGDNLYTASTLAIDVASGAIKGHFQYHPNDSWDWDEVSPPILVDYSAMAGR